MGQRLNVGEQILAQVRDNALADPLQNDGLQIGADHRKDKYPRIDGYARKQLRQGKIPGHKLLQRADDQRRDNVIGDGEYHQKQDQNKFG